MSRQQTRFIVQYVYAFYTKNYIYFLTNQPNDIEQNKFRSLKLFDFVEIVPIRLFEHIRKSL